ncbi:MAG: hypothetical protein H3C62_09595 [Gemmatimonadaceae bacterium]|nr:hypothetical protein [Gemmatimonadaceae bacterium]
MLNRLRKYLSQSPEARREHSAGWKGAFVRDAEGLTAFQRQCESTTSAWLAQRALSLTERQLHTIPDNQYVSARVGDTALVVWFHDDTIGIDEGGKGTRLEHWDFADPAAMLAAFRDVLAEHLEG